MLTPTGTTATNTTADPGFSLGGLFNEVVDYGSKIAGQLGMNWAKSQYKTPSPANTQPTYNGPTQQPTTNSSAGNTAGLLAGGSGLLIVGAILAFALLKD